MKNVLISVPANNPRYVIYLPTIWANLKTFADKSDTLRAEINWLDPIIGKDVPEKLLAPYGGQEIHVLGLSCYSWNAHTNMVLAEYIREKYPNCVIVAGGPHLDYKNTDIFAEHPYLDAIVLKDGEIPFKMILEQVVDGKVDLDAVPGLVLPPREGDDDGKHRMTEKPSLPQTFDEESPWLKHAAFFENMIAELKAADPQRFIGIPWEIDRGCPYACVFCDWGSNTGSSIRNIPLERVKKEVQWISKNGIQVCFITVANFGIDKRDEEILDALIDAKHKYGYPNVFIWNNAKMNVDRVVSMNERAFRAGLVNNHVLSVQHLNDEVLKTMNRAPVSRHRLMSVINEIKETKIPCVAQLIFGAPNDSPERFLGSLTGLMEMGVHDEYVAYPFDVIPNSPAAQPSFQKQWQVETVTRIGAVNKRDPNLAVHDYSTIIVATNSYNRQDFVDMYVHGRLIIALHNNGFTQLVSRYLRRSKGIAYKDFYNLLIEKMFKPGDEYWNTVYDRCYSHIADFISDEGTDMVEALPIEDMPHFDYYVNVEEYFHFKFANGVREFYEALARVLMAEYGTWDELQSILKYAENMIVDPSYDRRIGRRVQTDYDWEHYFLDENEDRAEPKSSKIDVMLRHQVSGSRSQFRLDWIESSNSEEDALENFTRRIVGKHYERVERGYFKSLYGSSSIDRFTKGLDSRSA
ncbi:MAG: radical SAM protein [Alphaproteobacteria bacterium]|nr:MAG: radical SAM protein [Alphaproteobacteria bacterium]